MNVVDALLSAAFLFFVGSVIGWCLEVLFRRFFSAKKWINPGFLTGPYLPLYGFGVTGLFAIRQIPIATGSAWGDALAYIVIMAVAMTAIEYVAGLVFIKGMKIKLWDYSDRRGNIQGIICPLFSFFWLAVSVLYYFVVDPYAMDAVVWFVRHIAFAFVVGMFFGVFLVDLAHSLNLTAKIRAYAKTHNFVVSFEKLKESIKNKLENIEEKKASFVFPFRSTHGMYADLEQYRNEQESIADKTEAAGSGEDKPADR